MAIRLAFDAYDAVPVFRTSLGPAAAERQALLALERSPPKWMPVRRQGARKIKDLGAVPVSVETGTAPVGLLASGLALASVTHRRLVRWPA
ncbi:hypothetical protein [Methylobacterium nodulans]|uniref:Uncharacterized protein n=1 Tax=Methylobacterium nodulans (strain LMG 21967 / CNCM I-2342 / ORS 2060) TaxID=460265 RepID=B8IJL9_METNO|nr:hypothetical protein [Methylobacterium nodulans]ACL58067.1 hypothetical protein Mnod_3136 [Methylobacterium nodulans ORS 2060]